MLLSEHRPYLSKPARALWKKLPSEGCPLTWLAAQLRYSGLRRSAFPSRTAIANSIASQVVKIEHVPRDPCGRGGSSSLSSRGRKSTLDGIAGTSAGAVDAGGSETKSRK